MLIIILLLILLAIVFLLMDTALKYKMTNWLLRKLICNRKGHKWANDGPSFCVRCFEWNDEYKELKQSLGSYNRDNFYLELNDVHTQRNEGSN